MAQSKYAELVEVASQQRKNDLKKAIQDSSARGLVFECVRELDAVNKHITVERELVEDAAKEYDNLGKLLVKNLRWNDDEIKIHPQGSTSTQTLVAAPTAEKFDIDAVCQVDVKRIDAKDPMAFFDEVKKALEEVDAEEKNRCLRVNYPDKRFYIDFTPSVPLTAVPAEIRAGMRQSSKHADTALAVVDRPTRRWKTSNPQGMVKWVSTQADRRILLRFIAEDQAITAKRADIDPVPIQDVPLADTLRVAIRLFKRHRDMAVKRNLLAADTKPISVIITTLLTQCYEGLADEGRHYVHPIELLADLAELLPNMVERRGNELWIANPTVDGENFAERWNTDNGGRHQAFRTWCTLLAQDLAQILECTSAAEVRQRVQYAFGCSGADVRTAKVEVPGWLTSTAPASVAAVPATRGLA